MRFSEKTGERIELAVPEFAMPADPPLGYLESVGLDAAAPDPAGFPSHHEPGSFENPKVLEEGGKGHRMRGGKLGDGGVSADQPGERGAADGIGEGAEDGVEGAMVNHLVKCNVVQETGSGKRDGEGNQPFLRQGIRQKISMSPVSRSIAS